MTGDPVLWFFRLGAIADVFRRVKGSSPQPPNHTVTRHEQTIDPPTGSTGFTVNTRGPPRIAAIDCIIPLSFDFLVPRFGTSSRRAVGSEIGFVLTLQAEKFTGLSRRRNTPASEFLGQSNYLLDEIGITLGEFSWAQEEVVL